MKKFKRSLLAILACIFIIAISVGISGCSLVVTPGSNSSNSLANNDTVKTVYMQAVDLGYNGSLAEFLELVKGEDGVGIELISIDSSGDLLVKFTDGSIKNLGNIKGEKGDPGTTITAAEVVNG